MIFSNWHQLYKYFFNYFTGGEIKAEKKWDQMQKYNISYIGQYISLFFFLCFVWNLWNLWASIAFIQVNLINKEAWLTTLSTTMMNKTNISLKISLIQTARKARYHGQRHCKYYRKKYNLGIPWHNWIPQNDILKIVEDFFHCNWRKTFSGYE